MNPWSKYLGRLLIILIWLFIISLPLFAFVIAARQQIQLGRGEHNHIRLFLMQEKDAEGVGFEWSRPFSTKPPCTQTTVRYFMWTGEPENVTFCQCFDSESTEALPAILGSCPAP